MSNSDLLRLKELVDNPTTRVPVCLCIDTSGSMRVVEGSEQELTGETVYEDGVTWNVVKPGGKTRISELQRGIEEFYKSILEDEIAVNCCEICIVEFNSGARLLQDFEIIKENMTVPVLSANGDSNIGEGVNLAIDLLEKRKNQYSEKGVDYHQPWLVIMTDGDNNGAENELNYAVSRVQGLIEKSKITVFPIGIGTEANENILRQFSKNNEMLKLKGLRFSKFFEWLSMSVSKTSQSFAGEMIEINFDDIHSWGELGRN